MPDPWDILGDPEYADGPTNPPSDPSESETVRTSDPKVKRALNDLLHDALGAWPPCETACTHFVIGGWSALGVANVIARQESKDKEDD